MHPNVVVAQSGGPSPVINNSLRGVLEGCRACPSVFGRVYGARHGIEGVLREEFVDLTAQPQNEIDLLATTPAAGAIGTCRYKLRPEQTEDFDRIIEVFSAHQVGFFFYIGGNDSMDTAHAIGRLAAERGLELAALGVPKTIDNDLGDDEFQLLDHTPGYGSAARYWMCAVQAAEEENAGSCSSDPVLVLQIMGRRVGFLPAAARLADPERRMPLQIYLPESGLDLDALTDLVNDELRRSGRCVVALSEGFEVGDLGARRDAFGHLEYGACEQTAQQAVVNHLNRLGLAARGWARGQTPGTDQRSSILQASTVDLEEAFRVALQAVEIARRAGGGWMATLRRTPGPGYAVRYDQVPLRDMANRERRFPSAWLAPNRIDVTDAFVAYAQPLLGDEWVRVPLEGGRQRFARLLPLFVPKRCPPYLPQAHRI